MYDEHTEASLKQHKALGQSPLLVRGWFPNTLRSGADGREGGLWTPHLLWTREANGSWRGRQHHSAQGAKRIRHVRKMCHFIKFQIQQGNGLAIGINQNMQIFMFSCGSLDDGCALYPST